MSYLREAEVSSSFPPFEAFREHFGFVPKIYLAQTLLPRLIEAEAALVEAVLFQQRALSPIQKECILLVVAAAHDNVYGVTRHYQRLRLIGMAEQQIDRILAGHRQARLPTADAGLLDFALKLARHGAPISQADVATARAQGLSDESILEAILVTAWANFLCSLSTGLGVAPDFEPREIRHQPPDFSAESESTEASIGPYLTTVENGPGGYAAVLQEQFGFVPNLFRAQTRRLDVVGAEIGVLETLLFTGDLTRVQKERILLVVSAANRNTYGVAVHSQILTTLGTPPDETDQIALDHQRARLPEEDKALLEMVRRLATEPHAFGRSDIERLQECGFSQRHVLEAVVMASFTIFLNTVQFGLGAKPDFTPRRMFGPAPPKKAHLSSPEPRPTPREFAVDPDAEAIAKVRGGDLDAFEVLILRHSKRVYRTLVGILGNADEARDAVQETFLKAFQHLGSFEGRARFSTWLVSIASNTGLQFLRERRPLDSLDDDEFEPDGFRPRQIRAWTEDPEQFYSRTETRSLVEGAVLKLPAKYRVVVMLRDMEQLSAEETAAALGLGIPAIKSRLLRGRLMLREALAPHFARSAKEVAP
jgi:RNA polymerase sigma-70 factor (ECF subfamily)